MTELARRLWQRYEQYHALTYFAPESFAAYQGAGLEGFWDGYFAGRAAPLGAVGAGAVAATFQGFAPGFVAKRVPAVWSIVTPDEAITLRLAGIDGAARRVLGGDASPLASQERLDVDDLGLRRDRDRLDGGRVVDRAR